MISSDGGKKSVYMNQPQGGDPLSTEEFSYSLKEATAQFSLGAKDSPALPLEIAPEIIVSEKNKKDYLGAALETIGINVAVWAWDRYIGRRGFANISFKTVHKNFKDGYAWDTNSFLCNQLEHPYHGAMYHSVARSNGLSFFESSIYTFLGSLLWEYVMETNRPSTNDGIMTTFGGLPLGEVLFRISDLVIDESSRGFERVLRESLAFLTNPACGYRFITGEAFKTGNPREKHYYSLNFPVGAYSSFTGKANFMIAAHLEYKDALQKNVSRLKPYDWFSFDLRLGLNDDGLQDKELLTTGFIAGKKTKKGLAGLFGVFDYIDTYTSDRISAVGLGPGWISNSISDSNLFLNSSGVLSGIFGGSSSSLDLDSYHFGKGTDEPYFLGPGMLGKIRLEAGKKGFSSIYTGFSQYWVHSIFTHTDEFLGILSLGLIFDLPLRSKISLEYDVYLRHATHDEERFSGTKRAIRALYILNF